MIDRLRHFLSLPAIEQRAYLWTAWWLVVIRIMLRAMSFEQISRFASRKTAKRASSRSLDLERLAAIIRNAGARIPSTCLSRSLAGALVLARFGYASEVSIGVSANAGFEAHAWLECEGRPVSDAAEATSRWTQLTRVRVGS